MQKRDLLEKDMIAKNKELEKSNIKVTGLETKLKKVNEEKSQLTHEKSHAEKNIAQLNQKIALLEKDVRFSLFGPYLYIFLA